MKKNNGFVCFVAAGLCSLVSVPSHAESGTVDIVLSASSNVYAVQMGDVIVTASGGNGTVTFFRSSGRPFVEGASATLQYAGFSKKTPSGLELEADCVATFSSEDTLLLLFERRSGDLGTSGKGTLHLMGGVGALRASTASASTRWTVFRVNGTFPLPNVSGYIPFPIGDESGRRPT